MSTARNAYRVTPKPVIWNNADGSSTEVVKLYGGLRRSIAIDYSEIPRLIRRLQQLLEEHDDTEELLDRLFTDG